MPYKRITRGRKPAEFEVDYSIAVSRGTPHYVDEYGNRLLDATPLATDDIRPSGNLVSEARHMDWCLSRGRDALLYGLQPGARITITNLVDKVDSVYLVLNVCGRLSSSVRSVVLQRVL